MAFAAAIREHKAKAMGVAHQIVRETIETFSENLVGEGQFNGPWTPLGKPEEWKYPPPADYRPGNARSSWFLTFNAASGATTDRTDTRRVNGLDQLGDNPAGQRIFISNSAPHIGPLNDGHSRQAPVGIMSVGEAEFVPMVNFIARRVSA